MYAVSWLHLTRKQIISGVGVLSYWASTFVFDLASYLIPFVVFLGLLYAFDVESECWGFEGMVCQCCWVSMFRGVRLLSSCSCLFVLLLASAFAASRDCRRRLRLM